MHRADAITLGAWQIHLVILGNLLNLVPLVNLAYLVMHCEYLVILANQVIQVNLMNLVNPHAHV